MALLTWGIGAAASAAEGSPGDAACAADEVSVVVEPGDLPIESGTRCAPPGTAAEAVDSAGWTIASHPQQRDYLCQVDAEPADRDCLRTDRYWSLFVSEGGEPWAYATLGAYSQPVDAGDSVALVWQTTGARELPSTQPTGAESAPADEAESASPTVNPQTRPPVGDTGESEEGLPGWVAPSALGGLALVGGVIMLVRRRGPGPS